MKWTLSCTHLIFHLSNISFQILLPHFKCKVYYSALYSNFGGEAQIKSNLIPLKYHALYCTVFFITAFVDWASFAIRSDLIVVAQIPQGTRNTPAALFELQQCWEGYF